MCTAAQLLNVPTAPYRIAELEKIVYDRTADIELVKEEVNVAEVRVSSARKLCRLL